MPQCLSSEKYNACTYFCITCACKERVIILSKRRLVQRAVILHTLFTTFLKNCTMYHLIELKKYVSSTYYQLTNMNRKREHQITPSTRSKVNYCFKSLTTLTFCMFVYFPITRYRKFCLVEAYKIRQLL